MGNIGISLNPTKTFEFFVLAEENLIKLFHFLELYCHKNPGIFRDISTEQHFEVYNSPINKVTFYCDKGVSRVILTVKAPSEEEAQKRASEFIKNFNEWRAALAGDSSLSNN